MCGGGCKMIAIILLIGCLLDGIGQMFDGVRK